ncbi:unnamed protein product [Caenorhabditis bovis]|uniref:ShKT domain-containing protein n=1 Tax=Caenorhabditis bovis TaxID=2654633 RepID=A0A8S1ELA3_9PELO|nr:unnamed protein product [Caenorhabditis bovis]
MLFLLLVVGAVSAQIGSDLNCTVYNGTEFVYTSIAVACSNIISDASCAALYPADDETIVPSAGTNNARPFRCYSTADATPAPIDAGLKESSISQCPKRCGFCCLTNAYSCSNKALPSINCATITQSQCNDPTWRVVIAQECPASCGLCEQGGCVDAVEDCANDVTICNSISLQDFVNANCQRTCARCTTSTTASNGGSGSCGTDLANCAAWARNGFCTNTFYSAAVRKQKCPNACNLC